MKRNVSPQNTITEFKKSPSKFIDSKKNAGSEFIINKLNKTLDINYYNNKKEHHHDKLASVVAISCVINSVFGCYLFVLLFLSLTQQKHHNLKETSVIKRKYIYVYNSKSNELNGDGYTHLMSFRVYVIFFHILSVCVCFFYCRWCC